MRTFNCSCMARAISKPAAKSKAKAGRTAAKKPAAWTNLKVAWPQPKQAISLRIDQDILDWFRDGGPGGESPAQVGERADRVVGRVRAVAGDVLEANPPLCPAPSPKRSAAGG